MSWGNFLLFLACAIAYSVSLHGETGRRNEKDNNSRRQIVGFKGQEPSLSNRMGRFLSLFTYVQFNNQGCTVTGGETGNCVAPNECTRKGGTSLGTCASGYGVCCMFLAQCGGIVRENGTFFINDGYPNSYNGVGSCQVTLLKNNPSICQYRLDFDVFNITGPETANHVCINDQFIVSGGNPSVPAICGQNNGNHIYVTVQEGYNVGPITLSVITTGVSFERTWKIRITQILCSSQVKADEGCLQYFTGVTGQITSFNFNLATGRQLSNQDYTVCIRAERNFCGIQYSQCIDEINPRNQTFTLSGNSNQLVLAMVGSTGSTNYCPNDYLIIPMATNINRVVQGRSTTVDRICGGVFSAEVSQTPATVLSTVRPFILVFHTDNSEAPIDQDNKGFCLNYVQQPCTNRLQK